MMEGTVSATANVIFLQPRLVMSVVAIEPRLQDYIDTKTRCLLPQFAHVYKGTALTVGYRGTSRAESANDMIQLRLPAKLKLSVEAA
jgi:hypothetical protein